MSTTLTDIRGHLFTVAAGSVLTGGLGSGAGRRLIAVAVMPAGAVIGAALVRHRLVAVPACDRARRDGGRGGNERATGAVGCTLA